MGSLLSVWRSLPNVLTMKEDTKRNFGDLENPPSIDLKCSDTDCVTTKCECCGFYVCYGETDKNKWVMGKYAMNRRFKRRRTTYTKYI